MVFFFLLCFVQFGEIYNAVVRDPLLWRLLLIIRNCVCKSVITQRNRLFLLLLLIFYIGLRDLVVGLWCFHILFIYFCCFTVLSFKRQWFNTRGKRRFGEIISGPFRIKLECGGVKFAHKVRVTLKHAGRWQKPRSFSRL